MDSPPPIIGSEKSVQDVAMMGDGIGRNDAHCKLKVNTSLASYENRRMVYIIEGNGNAHRQCRAINRSMVRCQHGDLEEVENLKAEGF
jgi:hypothetical protein